MPQSYCICCQTITETIQHVSEAGLPFICEECGTVVDDSPIQNPNDGNGFKQQSTSTSHWAFTLAGASGNNWSQLEALRNEDSPHGLNYRRSTLDKRSVLFTLVASSIDSVCSKLNLDNSLKHRIQKTWHKLRGGQGLASVHVKRSRAPVLGVACIYWTCRSEDMEISADRLARVADVKKMDLLGAMFNLEKLLGSPVPRRLQKAPAEITCQDVEKPSLESTLASLQSKTEKYHFDVTAALVETLIRLKVVPEELSVHLVTVCAYLLKPNLNKKKANLKLRGFCKQFALTYSAKLDDLETQLRNVFGRLAAHLDKDPSSHTDRYLVQRVRDFVQLMEVFGPSDIMDDCRIVAIN